MTNWQNRLRHTVDTCIVDLLHHVSTTNGSANMGHRQDGARLASDCMAAKRQGGWDCAAWQECVIFAHMYVLDAVPVCLTLHASPRLPQAMKCMVGAMGACACCTLDASGEHLPC